MSELISGKEALIALANGEGVQCANADLLNWNDVSGDCHLDLFTTAKNRNGYSFIFRLKPRTITINGVELAPCCAVGIDHTKNEVSIQFNNNEDAVKLNNLLLNIYGFRNA